MDIFNNCGIRVTLNNEEDFLKVRETLTRIGIATSNPSRVVEKRKSLIQSCHILCRKGQYAIMHFKELFILDALLSADGNLNDPEVERVMEKSKFSEDDFNRRSTIALLLHDWGLLKIEDSKILELQKMDLSKIKIIPYKDKHNWQLISKHSLGRKKIHE